jgi:hypothetical protein
VRARVAIEFDMFADSVLGDPASPHISVHTRYASANDASETFSLGNSTVRRPLHRAPAARTDATHNRTWRSSARPPARTISTLACTACRSTTSRPR